MAIGDFINSPMMVEATTVEVDEDGNVLTEKYKIKVNSKGEKTRRRQCPAGYKLSSDGKTCVKVNAKEKLTRSKSMKKAAKKRKSKQRMINQKTKKANKKRQSYGLDK